MRIALLSTYELGHQPIHIASPAAALAQQRHKVRTVDLAAQAWPPDLVEWADAIAFSTPMHTALRLATVAATRVRSERPDLPICAYGLYAAMASDDPFDRRISGEYEAELLVWASELSGPRSVTVHLDRTRFTVPERSQLPPLDTYAHLAIGSSRIPVGAVETTHGCVHRCRHCPLPTVYDGRIRKVDESVVLADIEQLVDNGAEHITFSDADFLNAPHHAMRIVEELHHRWPTLTYDATIKVEHLLRHGDLIERLVETGCVFVISAFESLNDAVLEILDKGHTRTDAIQLIHRARDAGLDLRPTWLPFTPWTTIDDLLDMFSFIATHDLIGLTDPIQMTIRLLVPAGSLLEEHPSFVEHRDAYDTHALSYRWVCPEPSLDALQRTLASQTESMLDEPPHEVFAALWRTVLLAAERDTTPADTIPLGATEGRPRLTEPWFC